MLGTTGFRRKRPIRVVIPAGSARIDVPDRTFGIPGLLGSSGGEATTHREALRMLLAEGFAVASRWAGDERVA
jgi:hypothetical protein